MFCGVASTMLSSALMHLSLLAVLVSFLSSSSINSRNHFFALADTTTLPTTTTTTTAADPDVVGEYDPLPTLEGGGRVDFATMWTPPVLSYGQSSCEVPSWMQTVNEVFVGILTSNADVNRTYLPVLKKKPLPLAESCLEQVERLAWLRMDRNGAIFKSNLDSSAYRKFQKATEGYSSKSSINPSSTSTGSIPDIGGNIGESNGGGSSTKTTRTKKTKKTKNKTKKTKSTTPSNKSSSTNSLKRRYIFGADNRERILCGLEGYFPSSAIGKVLPDCTGVLVGPRHVLTAAHCVHMGKGGGFLPGIQWMPALNCMPTNAPVYNVSSVYVPSGWSEQGLLEYDYALLAIDSPEPSPYWMAFGYNDKMALNWNMNIRGYMSEDLNNFEMYNAYRTTLNSISEKIVTHKLDIVRGTSGAPLYKYSAGSDTRTVYGIQSHHYCPLAAIKGTTCTATSGYNGATRITKEVFTQICGWINDPAVCPI